VLRGDGKLCFVDLEYFGCDDAVKLMADFLWHPAMNLGISHKTFWLHGMFGIYGKNEKFNQRSRFQAAWPVYGLRWALILLNEFRPDIWKKEYMQIRSWCRGVGR